MMHHLVQRLSWLVCLVVVSPALAAPRFLVLDLGGLQGHAMSPQGKLGGYTDDNGSNPAPARGTASHIEPLPLLPGGYYGDVGAVLDDTTSFGVSNDEQGHVYPVWWDPDGSIQPLAAVPGWMWVSITGANNTHTVVGYGLDAAWNFIPARWSGGRVEVLPTPSSTEDAFPTAINDAGFIALNAASPLDAYYHAYVLDTDNILHDLGELGGYAVYGNAIDADGVVTGSALDATGLYHAFLGGIGRPLQTLPDVAGMANCEGRALQSAKAVVGLCNIMRDTLFTSGVVWLNGQPVDLNTTLVDGQDWWIEAGLAINAAGMILADGVYQGGYHDEDYRSVLLVPEKLQNFSRLWTWLGLPPLP